MSDGFSITTNAAELAAIFRAAGARLGQRAHKLVGHWGVRLVASAKAHASGRPGPRMITGDLNRSIALDVGTNGGKQVARVGTNRPQARRLEFGFTGVDSLGRHYRQPPYPFFGPAHDEIAPGFEKAAGELLRDVLDG